MKNIQGTYDGLPYEAPPANLEIKRFTKEHILGIMVSTKEGAAYLNGLGKDGVNHFLDVAMDVLGKMQSTGNSSNDAQNFNADLQERYIRAATMEPYGLSSEPPSSFAVILNDYVQNGIDNGGFLGNWLSMGGTPGPSPFVTAEHANAPADPNVAADRLGGLTGDALGAFRRRPAAIEAAANP